MHKSIVTALWDGPPSDPPGRGRGWYLPEDFYFADAPDFPVQVAARVTARYVARWANRYECFATVGGENREDSLPRDLLAREALIDELFDSYEESSAQDQIPPDPKLTIPLNLYRGDVQLLCQPDGVPGAISLGPDEFAQLQDEWTRQGLPSDLYYPASEQRIVNEDIQLLGGVVQWPQRYSPLRWAQRGKRGQRALRRLGETDRQLAFLEACTEFEAVLARRILELAEPGAKRDSEEQERLEALARELVKVHQWAAAGGVPLPRRRTK